MTRSPRLLAALAAALAPDRAERLLALAAGPGAEAALREATRLAQQSRPQRLSALAAALAEMGAPAGRPSPAHPLLSRLARERSGR